MEKYASHFYFIVSAPKGFDIVRLGPGDYGLYARTGAIRNSFGTPLFARGTWAEIDALNRKYTDEG